MGWGTTPVHIENPAEYKIYGAGYIDYSDNGITHEIDAGRTFSMWVQPATTSAHATYAGEHMFARACDITTDPPTLGPLCTVRVGGLSGVFSDVGTLDHPSFVLNFDNDMIVVLTNCADTAAAPGNWGAYVFHVSGLTLTLVETHYGISANMGWKTGPTTLILGLFDVAETGGYSPLQHLTAFNVTTSGLVSVANHDPSTDFFPKKYVRWNTANYLYCSGATPLGVYRIPIDSSGHVTGDPEVCTVVSTTPFTYFDVRLDSWKSPTVDPATNIAYQISNLSSTSSGGWPSSPEADIVRIIKIEETSTGLAITDQAPVLSPSGSQLRWYYTSGEWDLDENAYSVFEFWDLRVVGGNPVALLQVEDATRSSIVLVKGFHTQQLDELPFVPPWSWFRDNVNADTLGLCLGVHGANVSVQINMESTNNYGLPGGINAPYGADGFIYLTTFAYYVPVLTGDVGPIRTDFL